MITLELSDAIVLMDQPTPGAITEPLNLRRDSLHASAITVQRMLEDLVWLANRSRDCREQGQPLPFNYQDLKMAEAALREVAGRLRQEQTSK